MLETIQKIEFEIILIFAGIYYAFYLSKQPPTLPLRSVRFQQYSVAVLLIIFGIIGILNKFKVW